MNENEKNITPALGAIPSPFDYRDELASVSMAETLSSITLPAVFHTDLGPVLNQGIEPACAAHDVVYLLKLYWFKKTGQWIDFSPRFLDTLAKRFDGQDRATGGTYIKLLMQLIVKYGCCTTATLPNDTTLPTLQYRNDTLLTPAVFAEAAKYTVPGYFAVPKDEQSTRASIYLYGAFGSGMEVSPEWFSNKGQPLPVPTSQVDIAGGHAITPNGWVDPKLNTLRNQWGAWGTNGDGEAPYDATAWMPFIFEQWAIAEIPADTLDFLKTLPSPANFHYEFDTDLIQGMQVIGGIDFSGIVHNVGAYATDPLYAEEISALYTAIQTACVGVIDATTLQAYIAKTVPTSPVTGAMIVTAATASNIDAGVLAAVLQHESAFGTLGAGSHTFNPGNVGNVDSGATHTFASWQDGVNACAIQLARRQMPKGKDDVRFLQIALMILGFLSPLAVAEFGIFGPKTAVANGAYQKSRGIGPVPSRVGPLTRAALNAQFAV